MIFIDYTQFVFFSIAFLGSLGLIVINYIIIKCLGIEEPDKAVIALIPSMVGCAFICIMFLFFLEYQQQTFEYIVKECYIQVLEALNPMSIAEIIVWVGAIVLVLIIIFSDKIQRGIEKIRYKFGQRQLRKELEKYNEEVQKIEEKVL